jgi:type IV fimbrial biogenesis protein FimT
MRNSAGFSLIEMLVTLSIGAILLSFAGPGFSDMVKNNRRAAAVTQLVVDLQYARSIALERGREVVVCPSASGTNCEPRPQWNSGWLVFLNIDGDQPPVRDPSEPVLRVTQALETGVTLKVNRDAFEFRPYISTTNGTFVFCDDRGPNHGTAVVVSIVGRVRLQKKTMPDGSPLDCLV